MTNKVTKTTVNRLKGAAVAAGLGLTAFLSGCATANSTSQNGMLKPTLTGIGYKSAAQSMSYDQVIKSVETPKEAIFYRDNCLPYSKDREAYGDAAKQVHKDKDGKENITYDYWASFKQIHEKGTDDCDGVSFAMAALLSDNNYNAKVLFLTKPVSGVERMFAGQRGDRERASQDEPDYHTVCLIQDPVTKKYGCIGVGTIEDRAMEYDTPDALAASLKIGWLPKGYNYTVNKKAYDNGILDLDKQYGREMWIAGDGNLKGKSKPVEIAADKVRKLPVASTAEEANRMTYIPQAYIFMGDGIRRKKSKDELVDSFHQQTNYSKEIAARHYDMAAYSHQQEQEGMRNAIAKAQAERAARESMHKDKVATVDNQQ